MQKCNSKYSLASSCSDEFMPHNLMRMKCFLGKTKCVSTGLHTVCVWCRLLHNVLQFMTNHEAVTERSTAIYLSKPRRIASHCQRLWSGKGMTDSCLRLLGHPQRTCQQGTGCSWVPHNQKCSLQSRQQVMVCKHADENHADSYVKALCCQKLYTSQTPANNTATRAIFSTAVVALWAPWHWMGPGRCPSYLSLSACKGLEAHSRHHWQDT